MADSYVGYAPANRISLAPGSVSVGALNTTGTASSSTYLRGDMSWAANPLGDVVGPGSSTDDALVKYDGTTGKLVQNSNATLTDAGTLTATAFAGALTGNVTGDVTGNVSGTAATVTTAAQPNITSTGTLLNFASTGIDDNADALAVTITSAEAVGVGETVPLGKLHVKSADAGSITPSGNADELILEGSAHAGMTIYSGTTSTGLVNFGDSGHDSPGQIIYDHDDNSMDFVTNTGVNRIHITSAGAVGIGQGTPAATLHLKHPSGGTYMRWQDGSSNYAYEWGVENGEGNAFLLKNITGSSVPLTVKTDGKIGIGVTAPTGTLDLNDGDIVRAKMKDYSETKVAMAAHDVDISLGNVQSYTLSGNQTLTFSNPITSGSSSSFTLYVTNGGSATLTWPTSVDWAGGSAPSLTSSGIDILVFTTIDAGTTWYGFASGIGMA